MFGRASLCVVTKRPCRVYALQISDVPSTEPVFIVVNSRKERKPDVRTHLLPSERAALGQSCLTTGGLAEDSGASLADDDSLGVGEDGGDGEASWALDVHEERSWTWDESLKQHC